MEDIFERMQKEAKKTCIDYTSSIQTKREYDTKGFPVVIKNLDLNKSSKR